MQIEQNWLLTKVLITFWQAIRQYKVHIYIRMDNGYEFIAGKIQYWLQQNESQTIYVDLKFRSKAAILKVSTSAL